MMHHRQFIVPNLSVTYLFWKAMLKGLMSSVQNDILSLVAASIFADKRVFASEIEAFVATAGELMALKSLGPKMTKAQLLRWYEANKDEIRERITAPYFKDWFYELLERLSDVQNKQSIIDAMEKISVADGSIHVSERALMTLAKRYWDMG